jgi:hypothetical protein
MASLTANDLDVIKVTHKADCSSSSAFKALYFNYNTYVAFVVFHDGDVWAYDVDATLWGRWSKAASLGRFYYNNVRGQARSEYIGISDYIDFDFGVAVTDTASSKPAVNVPKHAKGKLKDELFKVTATATFTATVDSLPEYINFITEAIAGTDIQVEFKVNG